MIEICGQKVNSVLIQTNKNGTISVNISVDPIDPAGRDKKVRITTTEVQDYLKNNGYQVISCIQSSVITNTSNVNFGTWLFEIFETPKHIKKLKKDL